MARVAWFLATVSAALIAAAGALSPAAALAAPTFAVVEPGSLLIFGTGLIGIGGLFAFIRHRPRRPRRQDGSRQVASESR